MSTVRDSNLRLEHCLPSQTAQDAARRDEYVRRSMDRLMATARYGRQPRTAGRFTEIVTTNTSSGREASLAIRESDIHAVLEEMRLGLPCGICGHNPCEWHTEPDA